MDDNIDNLILEHLRALRGGQDRIENELREIKFRLPSLERGQAKSHAEYAELYSEHARQLSVIDRLNERISRIEKRLELTD